MHHPEQIALRWTVGDVSLHGFAALRLSILGAWRIFGPMAAYTVCVNSLHPEQARRQTGAVPASVQWIGCDGRMPAFLEACLAPNRAEGVAWKFAPLRLFPDRYEIALDNDCILWRMPDGMRAWLASRNGTCLLAEDVVPAFGQFAALCGTAPRNTGIRGLPPDFDLEAALSSALHYHPVRLESELDEQGLQVAALSEPAPPFIVSAADVAICSPFPPHSPNLGRCGAHFVGINVKRERAYCDGATLARLAAHWKRRRPEVERALAQVADQGCPLPPDAPYTCPVA